MDLYEQLSIAKDCDFNGYLLDYLKIYKPAQKYEVVFKTLVNNSENWHLIVNYHFDLNLQSAANKIIHYKDIHKLSKRAFICPFICYMKQGTMTRAIIFADNFIIAKGLYLSLTEKGNIFEVYRNDIIALNFLNHQLLKPILKQLWFKKAGYLQRIIDHQIYRDYEAMYADAKAYAQQITLTINRKLNICNHKDKVIATAISHWFFLKKCVYVEYMVNKDILAKQHHGDQNAQRLQAKANADQIRIVPYVKMWNNENLK